MPDPSPNAAPPRSRRTLLWTATTYFGEGLPWSFLHQIATEFLTAIGASKTQIGSTSLLHLAVTFKFVWSPLVDLFGRRRTWLVLLQLILGAGMFVVAAISATRNMAAFWTALGVLAVLHATHDIACDGFYLQALNKAAQALYSGVRIAAFRVAMIVGSSVLVVLAGQTSWTLAFGGAGALMILIALVNMAVMPRIEDAAPATPVPLTDDPAAGADPGTAAGASKAERFFAAYRSFLSQPRAPVVLAFMFFYKLGDIMMFAMSKPLLRDIGVDTSHRGLLNGLGTFTFILGSVAGGALVARAGIERCLAPMTLFQNLAIPFYVLLAVVKPRFAGIVPVVLFEQFASGIGGAAHVVFLMRRCRAAFSASHYAFATAIVSLGSTLSGYASGPLNEALGHPWFFTVAFIASWPSLVLVWIVPKTEVEPSAPAVP